MIACKGSIRDIVVIVLITIAMLAVVHNIISQRSGEYSSSKPNLSSGNNVKIERMTSTSLFVSTAQPTYSPTYLPTISPTFSSTISTMPRLLSLNKPVTSDVRGNLGPPEVVTNEAVADWLKDRWQAAVDMSGRPIPGEHWLEVDLQDVFTVTSLLIDWEDGFSDSWTLKGRADIHDPWVTIYQSSPKLRPKVTKKHVIYSVDIPQSLRSQSRFIRLVIHRPATQWGSSVWRLQIWGY